jgi:hypothetical protein
VDSDVTVASPHVNQMKNRMQALGLLDRAFKAATDDDLVAMTDALDDDHRDGLESIVDELTPDGIRSAVRSGRIDGGMEAIATVLTDVCLAECIDQLGDHADNPTTVQSPCLRIGTSIAPAPQELPSGTCASRTLSTL